MQVTKAVQSKKVTGSMSLIFFLTTTNPSKLRDPKHLKTEFRCCLLLQLEGFKWAKKGERISNVISISMRKTFLAKHDFFLYTKLLVEKSIIYTLLPMNHKDLKSEKFSKILKRKILYQVI